MKKNPLDTAAFTMTCQPLPIEQAPPPAEWLEDEGTGLPPVCGQIDDFDEFEDDDFDDFDDDFDDDFEEELEDEYALDDDEFADDLDDDVDAPDRVGELDVEEVAEPSDKDDDEDGDGDSVSEDDDFEDFDVET